MTFLQTDAIRVTARMAYGLAGPDLINTMHLELLSPSAISDAQAVVDVGEFLEVLYLTTDAVMGTFIKYIDYTVQNLTSDSAPLTSGWPTFIDGGSGTQVLPPQVAALMLARTPVSRKFGRVYFAGLTEDGASSGLWSGATLTALTNFAAQLLLTQVRTNGSWRYVVKTVASPVPPTAANSYTAPISAQVIDQARTQRRRSLSFGS